ncbi:MAG: ABC-F family ATP-binding cassette domain-containing protein, partial [Anaerolineaceae bacterium]|nr:ABC-F family ATP-binding cassette domain-containing protein [Anaerolineaceae bacterium]
VKARGITTGYLPQQPEFSTHQTAFELALDGNPRLAALERELEQIEASLGDPQVYANEKRLTHAVERQQVLLEEYQKMGGEKYPQLVRDLLLGLGLAQAEMEKPISALSGGQKKLVGLARLLLASPQVLLLDEPDNHLDLAGKLYLERFIQNYPGAVVIVSHDRYLLDAVVTHIAELEDGKISVFEGDYSDYILDKQERLARQETLFQIQQREISRIEAAIKRYAIWAKVYDNEKFAKRARSIQHRLDKIDRMDRPILERRTMGLQLNGWRGSTKVLEMIGVCKAYHSRPVLEGIHLRLEHGERVGMIGKNGAGKSVLFRLLMEMEKPDQGEIIIGPSVKVAYYAQEHDTLNMEQTLIEAVRYAGNMNEPNAVSFLGRYLFTYKQSSQKIKELSGGERSRLQLALIVLSGANFLLLDEPTNNLDIASAEVLESALADFEGTALIISHDRYFLDQVVDRLLVLENGQTTSYPGGYSDYLNNMSSG